MRIHRHPESHRPQLPRAPQARREAHFRCLDMCGLHWNYLETEGSETAILLEVWRSGGLFQIDRPLSKGSTVTISGSAGDWQVEGTVNHTKQDEYGFLVEVRVNSQQSWFPRAYQPPYMHGTHGSHGQAVNQKILRAS